MLIFDPVTEQSSSLSYHSTMLLIRQDTFKMPSQSTYQLYLNKILSRDTMTQTYNAPK